MPSEEEIQDYLRHLNPVSPSDRSCPICFENYLTHRSPTAHPFLDPSLHTAGEYPVSVNSLHPNSACKHVFGRHCIERHFRSGGPWCTRCPTCREEWFDHEPEPGEEEIWVRGSPLLEAPRGGFTFVRISLPQPVRIRYRERPEPQQVYTAPSVPQQQTQAEGQSTAPATPADEPTDMSEPVPPRDGAEAVTERSGTRSDEVPNAVTFGNRGKVHRSLGFLERILMTAEIDDADDELNARVLELESAVFRLWDRLDSRGRERDAAEVSLGTPDRHAGSGAGAARVLYA